MRGRALARDGEVGSRLFECGPLVDAELLSGNNAQDTAQLRARTERHEHQAVWHGGGQS